MTRALFFALALLAVPLLARGADPVVPAANQEQGQCPAAASFTPRAQALVQAINADDPALAVDVFFPAAAFDLVKDLPVPGRYHRRLSAWFVEDLRALAAALPGDLVFERFELGRCRWTARGVEGNRLPYWSCWHNTLHVRRGGKSRRIDVVDVINWGEEWYVTHLGPVRK